MTGSTPEGAGVRRDAVRNHRRLLDAATQLLAEEGADALTMDRLARRAGVGKGTVFRRFGNRARLMQALLEQAERDFLAACFSGPPPLGPGAPPAVRLEAFGRQRLRLLADNSELARAADVDPRVRYRHPSRLAALEHVTGLLRLAGTVPDPELAGYQLAAFLDAGLLLYLREDAGMTQERLEKAWADLVAAVTGPGGQPGG